MEGIKDEVIYGNQYSLSKYTLMQSISGGGVTIAVYLVLVLKVLPAFMMNRKPLEMKRVLLAYNVSQVVFSAYMLYIVLNSLLKACTLICLLWFQYSDYILGHGLFPKNCPQINPNFYQIVSFNVLLYFIAKHADLLDTVFFALRKKDNQLSFLHIYHHSTMIMWAWISYVYIPTDHFVVIAALNCFVHVLMYTYYAISSLGPRFAKYIWWKKHLTKVQLIQFVLGSTCTYYQQKSSPCPIPDGIHNFVMFLLCSFFALFMEFYFRSYINRRKLNKLANNNEDVQSYIKTGDEIKKNI